MTTAAWLLIVFHVIILPPLKCELCEYFILIAEKTVSRITISLFVPLAIWLIANTHIGLLKGETEKGDAKLRS